MSNNDFAVLPAKYTAQSLLYELFALLDRRIQHIVSEEPIVGLLNIFFTNIPLKMAKN
jgi:hypothetical protein